jgi:hypothetical protein
MRGDPPVGMVIMRTPIAASFGMLLLGAALPQFFYGQFQQPPAEELSMSSDAKAPGAAAVYFYREETTDDPHHFRTVYARLKILSADGLKAATVHIPYQRNFVYYAMGDNSSRLAINAAGSMSWSQPDINHSGEDAPIDAENFNVKTDVAAVEGRTIHPDGTIVPLSGSPTELVKIERNRANGISDISFTMPAVTVGSILEYRYQIRYDRFEEAPEWQIQQPYFVHRAHYVFIPAEQMLRSVSAGMSGSVTDSALTDQYGEIMTDINSFVQLPGGVTLRREATGRYGVDLTDIPALPSEPFTPAPAAQAYQVDFFYTSTPDAKDFWQKEMSTWTKLLNGYTTATPQLQHALGEIVSPGDAADVKAKKIFLFVQKLENTDFNPNGVPDIDSGWIPRGHVDRLLETKKGSSNQLAFLYLGLARAAGLNARAVRVASRSHRVFNAAFMGTDQLDTVLVELTVDGNKVFVDPGVKMAPYATLHWAHAAAGGLAMDGSKVETLVTPMQKNSDNSVLHVGAISLTPHGDLSGTVKVAFIGQRAIELRQLGVRSGGSAVEAAVNELLAKQLPQGVQAKVDHVAYLDDPSHQLLAVVNVSGTLATQADGRIALPRALFAAAEANPFPPETRVTPIDVKYPGQDQEQITYTLPPGLSPQEKPQDAIAKDEPNAVYQLKTKADAGTIVSTRVLAHGFTLLDAKEYTGLSDFYQKVTAYDRQQILLNAAQAGKGQ